MTSDAEEEGFSVLYMVRPYIDGITGESIPEPPTNFEQLPLQPILLPECFLSNYRTFRLSIQESFLIDTKMYRLSQSRITERERILARAPSEGFVYSLGVLEEEYGWLDADNFGWLIGGLERDAWRKLWGKQEAQS